MPERRGVLLERLAAASKFAEKIKEFADRPKNRMDAFSQILSGVQLTGAVFFRAEFSAPWGLTTPVAKAMAFAAGLGEERLVVLYHLVVDGGAVVELLDGQQTELNPGDIVVFPHGHSHHMSSGPGQRPFPNYGISAKIKARDLSPLRAGGGGDVSRFVCGYMSCDPHLSRPIPNRPATGF